MKLSDVIKACEADFKVEYSHQLLPSHLKALAAMKTCRTTASPLMLVRCEACEHQQYIPHSCGHRNCPHCQHHESQQWLERQLEKQVPAYYYLITFTLPAELRPLCWQHQRTAYDLLFECAWATLHSFSQNDKALQGTPGAIAVLHTHSRRLDYHPHVHVVMPAAAIDQTQRLWREKKGKYLFNHKALAKVFRGKMLAAITREGLTLPTDYPKKWIVDCKSVGQGDKALIYLGRYLYRGVIQEKDILSCVEGQVTYRYQDSQTKRYEVRTVSGAYFLWLLVQHVLPKGFRRARNYGFLHPNSKRLIQILQFALNFNPQKMLSKLRERPHMTCKCCGAKMAVVKTRIIAISVPVNAQVALE